MAAADSDELAWRGRTGPLVGFAWVTISMALFAVLAVGSRLAIEMGYHAMQVVFLRNASARLRSVERG